MIPVRILFHERETMIVWTESYRPFVMGGKTHVPIGTELTKKQLGRKCKLGKGFFGYVVSSPVTGNTHVIESTTGAFVGTNLAEVRAAIAECTDIEIMKVQIAEGLERKLKVELMKPKEFWEKFR